MPRDPRSGLTAHPALPRPALMTLGVAALVIGAALVAYSPVMSWVSQRQAREAAEASREAAASADEQALATELEEASTYNEALREFREASGRGTDWNVDDFLGEWYEGLLDLDGTGVMGTLSIPAIDLELPVYHSTEDDVLRQGVGHMELTSLPVGGASTHAVLTGHNGLPEMRVFDLLDQVEVGDLIVMEVLGEEHAYEVTSVAVVLPDETESLAIVEGEDLLTLVTCVPYGSNTHRLLVHASRCELPEGWDQTSSEDAGCSLLALIALVAIPILAAFVLPQTIVRRRRR